MWTAETRRTYDRKGLRYPTDGTDAEWELARPFIDVAQRGPGRQRRVDLREVLNAVFYVLGTGCPWRAGHGLPVACWARAARGVLGTGCPWRAGHGLPVACSAQGLAPAQHRARRLCALAV